MVDAGNSTGQSVCENVVSNWLSSSSWTLQYPASASSLLKCLAPTNSGFISSSVGILWEHRLIDSFSLLGSRQIRRLPSRFVLYTMIEHQSVCSLTFRIIPVSSICFSPASIFGFRLILHFLRRSTCGSASSFSLILAVSARGPKKERSRRGPCQVYHLRILLPHYTTTTTSSHHGYEIPICG